MRARAYPFVGRERDIPREPRGRTPLGAPRASDSYFLINNFNDAPRQFRYKARTYMQIPPYIRRQTPYCYLLCSPWLSYGAPCAHAGVPADHFSYQRSLPRRETLCPARPACPRFVDFTRVIGTCICSLLRFCGTDLASR